MFVAAPRYTGLSPQFMGKIDMARCIWERLAFSGFPSLLTTSSNKLDIKNRVAWSLDRLIKACSSRYKEINSRINVDLHWLVSVLGLQKCI